MTLSIGLDFGTTNSVAMLVDAAGAVEPVRFTHDGESLDAFRSVLCFSESDEGPRRTDIEAGPWAIDRFVETGGDCRFIQSFKTFAASALFSDTLIYNRRLKFEDLLAAFLTKFRDHASINFPPRVVIGRPVSFAGADLNEHLARQRYETALRSLGFEDIHHVYEPVAAAYFFAQRLTSDATVLVADFGGGTSDFSVVKFRRGPAGLDYQPLAHAGVAVAGDAFDFRIIDRVVARAFGKGSEYKSWDKILPVPIAYYQRFARWHELSLMRHSRDYRELQDLVRSSLEPARLRAFLSFLDADAGYDMYRAVSAVKTQLSRSEAATFSLHVAGVDIERTITRDAFESWIAPELQEIDACVGRVLRKATLEEHQIDRVFLTGGSSYVPAVQALFANRFGAGKIETGDQLVSIAHGLSLIGREPDLSRWAA